MNFIVKHWQGAYSLRKSFWVNYVALNFILSFAFAYFLLFWIRSGHTTGLERYLMNYYLISFGVSLWQAVGVYRSSVRYEKTTGKKVFPWIARMLTLFSTGHALLSFLMILTLSPTAHQELITHLMTLANV